MNDESVKPEYFAAPNVLPYAQPRPAQGRDRGIRKIVQWFPLVFATAFPFALVIAHFAPEGNGDFGQLEEPLLFMFLCCPILNLVGIFLSAVKLYQAGIRNRVGLVSITANVIALTAFFLCGYLWS